MDDVLPTREMTIAEILDRWPETAAVFQHWRTACVGCVMAPFDTIQDAARYYHLDEGKLLSELQQVAQLSPQSNS